MDGDPWLARAMPDMLNSKVLHPSWQKMLPIYCSLKRYKMALWLDSDIYVTDPQQPLELLLKASGFLESALPSSREGKESPSEASSTPPVSPSAVFQ
jgi:hypothetical protein